MNYDVVEINNGVAKIRYSEGTFAFIELASDMTEAQLDDIAFALAPPSLRTGEKPTFLSAGTSRTAAKTLHNDTRPAWQIARQNAYGSPEDQLEYITENGLDAWQTKVAQIKADNPKS